MPGRNIECHRWIDGQCDGGACETCPYEAVNAMLHDKDMIKSLKIALVLVIIAYFGTFGLVLL